MYSYQTHIVELGDDLEQISQRYYGNKLYWPYIWKFNVDMFHRDQLEVCIQYLKIKQEKILVGKNFPYDRALPMGFDPQRPIAYLLQ